MKLPKFIEYFRRSPNGETIRVEDSLRDMGDGYFRKIGQYFKTAQIVLLVVLFLFVTVFTLIHAESVTYQNLYYFVKDFRTAVDNTDASVDGIAYEADSRAFASFKGGLAVAGRERLTILTAAGGVNATDELKFNDPCLSAATDLLLVYARGEHTIHFYNSFTKLHSETTEHAIKSAYLSESGAYSVVTGDSDYASAVSVYSRKHKKISKYNLNSYAISAPLSENGKTVAILSYTVSGGVYETRLRLAAVGTDRVHCDYTVSGEYPLGVAFTENDTVLVLTSGGLHIVTEKNGGVMLERFENASVGAFSLDETGAVLSLVREGARSDTVKAYTGDGEVRFEAETDGAVRILRKRGESVFYRTDEKLSRLSLKDGSTISHPCTVYGGELVPVSEDRVLLAEAGCATYYRFSSK